MLHLSDGLPVLDRAPARWRHGQQHCVSPGEGLLHPAQRRILSVLQLRQHLWRLLPLKGKLHVSLTNIALLVIPVRITDWLGCPLQHSAWMLQRDRRLATLGRDEGTHQLRGTLSPRGIGTEQPGRTRLFLVHLHGGSAGPSYSQREWRLQGTAICTLLQVLSIVPPVEKQGIQQQLLSVALKF